jgi:hypothetical protein
VSETFPPPEPAPPAPPSVAAPRAPFRLPGDYYESPLSEVKPVFPRWVPIGCGAASIVFVVLLFIGGSFAGGGGVGRVLDFAFDMMQAELMKAYGPDVTPAQRSAFEHEYAALRANLRANRLDLAKVQALLRSISDAQEDKKLSSAEVTRLTNEMTALDAAAKK